MNTIKLWPVIRPLIALLSSRKFLTLMIASLISLGLDISPETQAGIIGLGVAIFMIATAWEDTAAKRAGGTE